MFPPDEVLPLPYASSEGYGATLGHSKRKNITNCNAQRRKNIIAVEPIPLGLCSQNSRPGRHAQHVHALASLNALGSSEQARAVGVVEM